MLSLFDLSEEDLKQKLYEYIPLHPDLDVLFFSEQRLAMNTSRILVTMQRKQREQQQLASDGIGLENSNNIKTLNQFRDKYFKS